MKPLLSDPNPLCPPTRTPCPLNANPSNIGPLSRGKQALSLGRAAGLRPGRTPQPPTGAAPLTGADAEELQAVSDSRCDDFVELAFNEISGINIYQIYADICNPDPPPEPPVNAAGASPAASPDDAGVTPEGGRYRGALLGYDPVRPARAPAGTAAADASMVTSGTVKGSRRHLARVTPAPVTGSPGDGAQHQVGQYPHPGKQPRYDPCIDNKVDVYLNRPEVRGCSSPSRLTLLINLPLVCTLHPCS